MWTGEIQKETESKWLSRILWPDEIQMEAEPKLLPGILWTDETHCTLNSGVSECNVPGGLGFDVQGTASGGRGSTCREPRLEGLGSKCSELYLQGLRSTYSELEFDRSENIRQGQGVSERMFEFQMTNEILQRLTKNNDAAERATATKWTWGGTCGETTPRWTHAVTMWDLYVGKKGQGRPRLRWSDMFAKYAEKQWSMTAKNRVLWKELEKVMVSR
ncbi:hypothetical protein ANN_04774 [Periplaneta americana]|uniref:Uncharacterized protein n=1 Tax=Periplaneta americana TaxID=6978 RepID=A0ABQ8T9F0_PERAM|nr:hypothetical protein ANN_04774 [Periplaneta americana]